MEFAHKGCGGLIDVGKRRCLKCDKHWNPISFLINNDMTMVQPTQKVDRRALRVRPSSKTKAGYADWMERNLPGVAKMTNILPNWPRWARVLSAVVVVAGVVTLVLWLVSCTPATETVPVEEPNYRIEVIDSNLLVIVVEDTDYDNTDELIEALKEVKKTYTILNTTAITQKRGYGSITGSLLVQVEGK